MAERHSGQDEDFDAVAVARRLMLDGRTASLATLRPDGAPYVSLIEIAADPEGAPITLISKLALHTRNLEADPRSSILIDERGSKDALRQARLSLSGRLERAEGDALKTRFLARHPDARRYAGFADFAIWRLVVDGAHLVAGFGRIVDLTAAEILLPLPGNQ